VASQAGSVTVSALVPIIDYDGFVHLATD
jgi:hypothetical protein